MRSTRGYVFAGALLAVLIAAAFFLWHNQPATITDQTATPAQIFEKASSDLGFARDDVSYFYIYGDDRIQYYLASNRGVTFAYKENGAWHISGPGASQEEPLCSLLQDVPEHYRQACYVEATDESLYMDAQGQNANYPKAEGIRYM